MAITPAVTVFRAIEMFILLLSFYFIVYNNNYYYDFIDD